MDTDFQRHLESLLPAFERLIGMDPIRVCSLPRTMPTRGVYLFSEGRQHLYVGRTNRLRQRLQEHCRASSTHNSAPFAFLLARNETGKIDASYMTQGSRKALEENPRFRKAFLAAKQRVSKMDVRFVEEVDPIRQALLEMYVSIALRCRYNSFENH